MNAMDAVKQAAERSGTQVTDIGPAMGKSRSYVSTASSKESRPRYDTLAAMLGACNYKLCAVPCEDVPASAIVIE